MTWSTVDTKQGSTTSDSRDLSDGCKSVAGDLGYHVAVLTASPSFLVGERTEHHHVIATT